MRHLFFLLLLFTYQGLHAQYYSVGEDPSYYRWRTIKSKEIHLTYPDFYEAEAQKIAQICDSLFPLIREEMKFFKENSPVPLLLHAGTSISNAFSAWAPRRIEWFTCTPQNTYAQPWFEQLALHESRHELQVQRLNQNTSGFLTKLLGEQFIGATIGLFVPNWFMEGDAVWAETVLSETGRGRDGDFLALSRAQIQEKGIYTYDKAIFGSYKDYVPNSYLIGYHLVSYANKKVKENFWQEILTETTQLNSLRPFHAKGERDIIYLSALREIQRDSSTQREEKTTEECRQSPPSDFYTNYFSPFFYNEQVYALKSSYKNISRLIRIDSAGTEEKIYSIGGVYDGFLSQRGDYLTWVEVIPDKRWQTQTYTNPVVLNLKEGSQKRLSKNMHYFSPSISHDQKKIVLVHNDLVDKNSLHIFDLATDSLCYQTKPFQEAISYPCWSDDDQEIYFISLTPNGKNIQKLNLLKEEIDIVLPNTYSNIRNLKFEQGRLYFISDQSGVSQVYAWKPSDQQISQITSSRYGVGYFEFSKGFKELVFTNYTADGYEILTLSLNEGRALEYKANGTETQINPFHIEQAPLSLFESKPYRKAAHLFNFHSWAPASISPQNYTINPGISAMSQNLLNTSFLSLGYSFNQAEASNQVFVNYTYSGFYPILSTTQLFQQRKIKTEDSLHSRLEFRSQYGAKVPFQFARSNHLYGFAFSGNYEYVHSFSTQARSSQYSVEKNQLFAHFYGGSLQAYHSLKKAYSQLEASWKQTIQLSVQNGLFQSQHSKLIALNANAYFPGWDETHSLHFYTGIQKKINRNLLMMDMVRLARGFQNFDTGSQFISTQFDYSFPIAYPDRGIPGWYYCKRLVTSLFTDQMYQKEENKVHYSFGFELFGDFHFFRFDYPITFGFRYSVLPQTASSRLNLIFNVSI